MITREMVSKQLFYGKISGRLIYECMCEGLTIVLRSFVSGSFKFGSVCVAP